MIQPQLLIIFKGIVQHLWVTRPQEGTTFSQEIDKPIFKFSFLQELHKQDIIC